MILTYNIARKGTRMSHLRRISTAALALFLALTPAAAWAGPDQDKDWIVTGQHVDAPIPVWHDDTNSFSLNTINMPMENTALWIPKAWTGTGEKDEAKSQLVIPAKRPDLSFLGAEGTVLNAAPQNPGPGNTPIWAGLGAGEIGDTDKFEGETYTLDLISVDGPGRMEMFIDNGDSVNRFLSSHDTAYRSVYNPRHTHLYTTFTQPGRYVANYKMTARSADGTAIYSSPITPLVWQVGGANPADGTIKDIESAYNGARAERTDGNAATPTLTVSHHAEREHPGDNHLTDIMIDTGVATDTGRAWITVNGYFLTEVAVEGGRATISELLGADTAAVQAVYIPGDSASARWISQTVQYSQKDTEPVTVGGTDTILGPSNPDPAPVWNPDYLPISSRRVEVSYDLLPGSTDQYTATVRANDPTLRANYKIDSVEELAEHFVMWEYAIAMCGYLMRVCPFDQPDVASAKAEVLKILAEGQPEPDFVQDFIGDVHMGEVEVRLAPCFKDCTDVRAVLRALLGSIQPGDFFALNAFLPFTGEGRREALEDIRHGVGESRHVASCLEVGPRYLHSTGQLQKGGPNCGVFLILSADELKDIPLKREAESLGALAKAQASGDLLTLASRGRRCVHLHLPDNSGVTLRALAAVIREILAEL